MNISIFNDTKLHYIIGNPISHSLSPIIYNTLYARCDMNIACLTAPVPKGALENLFSAQDIMRACAYNFTIPHKSDVIACLDEIDLSAKRLESVNTVVLHENKRIGYSTDGEGYVLSLAQEGISLKNQDILILGAGGAAAPIAFCAAEQDAKSITILARRIEAAQELAMRIQDNFSIHCNFGLLDSLNQQATNTSLLINTTPLGMSGVPHDFASFDFIQQLPEHAIVSDIVPNPIETNLLRAAEKRNLKTVSGIGMLIWQAFAAFEKFYDCPLSKDDLLPVKLALKKAGFPL